MSPQTVPPRPSGMLIAMRGAILLVVGDGASEYEVVLDLR